MKSISLVFLFCLSLAAIQAFECPQNETIYPCTCFNNQIWGPTVDCQGEDPDEEDEQQISQSTINSLFSAIRNTNNLSISDSLYLYQFRVQDTSLTQLDLSPLQNVRLDYLEIKNNPYLSSIVGGSSSNDSSSSNSSLNINARVIYVKGSNVDDAGLASFLRNFVPTAIASLDLSHNQLVGASGEFIPGLSSLTQLYRLYLNNNRIKQVSGSQFKANNRLGSINLEGNPGVQFGQNAFDFNEPNFDVAHSYLVINLTNSLLTEASFSNDSQIDNIKRPISLQLEWNKIETLPAATFQPFLEARSSSNMIYLQGNALVCDLRMKWLKDRRDEWENQVRDAYCVNDFGRTIWTSELTG